jgi:hypothetical protein
LVLRLRVSSLPGRRGRVRRGGYLTRREAVAARDALLNDSGGTGATVEAWTVATWLRYWLTTRTSIRPSTLRSPLGSTNCFPHLQRIDAGEALPVELLAEDLQHYATQLRRHVTGSARQVLTIASGAASAAPTPAGQIAGGVLAVLASLVHGPRQRKPITLFRIDKTEPPTASLPAGQAV